MAKFHTDGKAINILRMYVKNKMDTVCETCGIYKTKIEKKKHANTQTETANVVMDTK